MRRSGFYVRKDGKSKVHFFDNLSEVAICGTDLASRHKMKRITATEISMAHLNRKTLLDPELCLKCIQMIGRR